MLRVIQGNCHTMQSTALASKGAGDSACDPGTQLRVVLNNVFQRGKGIIKGFIVTEQGQATNQIFSNTSVEMLDRG